MKNQLFLFLFVLSLPLSAQNDESYFKVFPNHIDELPEWAQKMYGPDPNVREVDFLVDAYYADHLFEKNIHTQNYKHWRRMIEPWLDNQGFIRRPSFAEEELLYKKLAKRHQDAQEKGVGWSSLGPFETYDNGTLTPISWQVNVYCVEQHETNTDLLYAGTEGGGVFKSTDHGLTWQLTTANEPFANGIRDIKIDPQNENTVYVGANQRIYRSTDAGGSWEELTFFGAQPNQIRIHPNNSQILFCAADNGLYRSR
ncbi:MAG: exo-alpha-sialidase, partial [Phaeodactylibacter sp.]|nr:exo-alpha-sialidase [Phaeodactylibacter sp.]